MTLTLSSLSTDYIQVPVRVNGSAYDPTSDDVQIAFIAGNASPQEPDWNTAAWNTPVSSVYQAQVLVGPANDGIALAPGTYTVWVKIVDNPEVPVRAAGYLMIT